MALNDLEGLRSLSQNDRNNVGQVYQVKSVLTLLVMK